MSATEQDAETDNEQSHQSGAQETLSANPETDTADTTRDTDAHELPLDQVFELLSNSRRRETIHYLTDNDSEATLSDLAEHIAALENDVPIKALTSSQRKRVYVALYQCHLPKIDDMGIVTFDKNRGTVELTANVAQLEPYLGESDTTIWPLLYGGVTAGGFGLVALSSLGTTPAGLTPTIVGLVILGVFALCSAVHVYAATDLIRELFPE